MHDISTFLLAVESQRESSDYYLGASQIQTGQFKDVYAIGFAFSKAEY